MDKIHVTQNQFSDLINLINGVFFPLKSFVTKEEFFEIVKNKKFHGKFFPMPIFFGINKKTYLNFKNKIIFDLYYKKKYLMNIYNVKFYNLDKKFICRKIYGKNYQKHPYSKKFLKENYKFISFDYQKINKKNLKYKNFISP